MPAGNETRRVTTAGTEYDLYEPAVRPARTTILVSGLTRRGEKDDRLVNFARAMAASGLRPAAAALPGLKSFRFDEAGVRALIDLASVLADETGAPVGLAGFSVGGGLALLAAADPQGADLFDHLLLFGPYYSLPDFWAGLRERLRRPARTEPEWDDVIYIHLALEHRRIETSDLDGETREALAALLLDYCCRAGFDRKKSFYDRYLKPRPVPAPEGPDTDPAFMRRLSPEGKLGGVKARVALIHDPKDELTGPDHSERIFRELADRRPGGDGQKLLVTPLISHVTPGHGFRIGDYFKLVDLMGILFQ